jgi:hypothetical protein
MGTTTTRTENFLNSIGINTHMAYTDGAYANVGNVQADLAYLGITTIRDSVPIPNGGTPSANQVTALETLAKAGIHFDLLTYPNSMTIKQAGKQIIALDNATPGAVIAVEGPNEINNFPIKYEGLTGQAAAVAFQTDLYSAVKANAATANIAVYGFTGGAVTTQDAAGTMTRNANGSYTLVNGQMGYQATLPTGVSTITISYTGQSSGNPGSGLFTSAGGGQKTGITYGSNGTINYTYNNTSGAAQTLFIDLANWNETTTITNVVATGPGSTTNLVNFDPNLSLSGQADFANIHPYASNGGAVLPLIASNYQTAYGSATPGPRVITETGYATDPNGGVSQTVQAQQIVNGLLDAYQSGVSTTYLYELLDEKADPNNTNPEMHFGLFNNNNTPKLAAIAVHDLTAALADPGANASSFTAGTLNYSATGASAGDQSMLFEKSTGEFDIALWNDGFAGTTKTDNVTLNLGANFASVVVEDVVTGAQTTYTNVSQLNIALGGDPMLVQIAPGSLNAPAQMKFAAAAPAAAASATWVTATPATTSAAASIPTITPTTSAATGLIASVTTQPSHGAALVTAATQHTALT